MSGVRIRRTRVTGYTLIPNDTLRDPRMSAKARGVLVTLLSHETDWMRSAHAVLYKEMDVGREAVTSALNELRVLGYVTDGYERKGRGVRRFIVVSDLPGDGSLGAGEPDQNGPEDADSPWHRKPVAQETRGTGTPSIDEVTPRTKNPIDEVAVLSDDRTGVVTTSDASGSDGDVLPLARKPRTFAREVVDLVEVLREQLEQRDVPVPKVPSRAHTAWLWAADRLLRLDERPLTEVVNVLMWSQQHEFWSTNIHSMPKFREKYVTLAAQMKRKPVTTAVDRHQRSQERLMQMAVDAHRREQEEERAAQRGAGLHHDGRPVLPA